MLFLTNPSNIVLGTAPNDGLHRPRLAVEQIYGYMVRNAIVFGVLTTMKGWCFLYRVNGGGLFMTPMFGDFFDVPNISQGAQAEGYHIPQNFTIMQALYFLSAVAEASDYSPE